jgi:hypothetical protein
MLTRQLSRIAIWLLPAVVLIALGLLLGVLRPALGAASQTPSPTLPDLVADAPDAIGLSTDSSSGSPRLLLRFNGYIHNIGPGALDFRGSRVAPTLSPATEQEVKEAEEKKEGLPAEIEAELAASPMHATQRLFTTNVGEEETNIERAHVDETSSAQLLFSSADGHHHWHLQHAARYSLWNAEKSAEVAPAQKVGFCLDDSQHVDTGIGPATPVYADSVPPFRDFCQQYRPNATSLFEGISAGWRDLYSRELAFQWVDASNVAPGEYWLREEVNPEGVIKEAGGANTPVYAASPTVIPGFDALAQSLATDVGEATTITLTAQAFDDSATPKYSLVTPPQHGELVGGPKSDQAIYRPAPGYSGSDSFTFSAADPNSGFPTSPEVATVTIQVGEPAPSVAIEGAPEALIAGLSAQLEAKVQDDSPVVAWSASAGTITPAGLYTAPAEAPAGGVVTITVVTSRGAHDQRTIKIDPVPVPQPSPEAALVTATTPVSGAGAVQGVKTIAQSAAVSRPQVALIGRSLIMTTLPTAAGRVRLSAYLGKHRLGTCATATPADRSFTCRLRLARGLSAHARISVLASLRIGRTIVRSWRAAAPIKQMQMRGGPAGAQAAIAAARFWCTPSAVNRGRLRDGATRR